MTTESLIGSVERITFHQPDTGFCVLRIKVQGQREFVNLVGKLANVSVGESIQATGEWINNKSHGLQFNATECHVVAPTTQLGMEKYLASGAIKGIGPETAKALLLKFGEKIFDVIELEPDALLKIPGMGKKRRDLIVESWAEQKAIREIMTFLYSHGIGTTRAMRIFKKYGTQAIARISENPYYLALDIEGFGFASADQIAMRMGMSPHAMERAEAGIRHVLQAQANNGHCAMNKANLLAEAITILAIPEAIIEAALAQELLANHIKAELINTETCYYLANLFNAEKIVADHIKRLDQGKPKWGKLDLAELIPWVEQKTALELSESQKAAIKLALTHKLTIITGGPGVGKTTIINSILQILRAKELKIKLCAPTGRAAQRLTETTGIPAQTMHRLLGIMRGSDYSEYDQDHPLDVDFLVVDEMSMVDIILMSQLLPAIPSGAAVLLVGDSDQLPSVGPGAVLADLIASNVIPCMRLTEIFRQAATSQIIVNAHRINKGELPLKIVSDELNDFYFIEAKNPEIIHDKLLQVVLERIPNRFGFDPIDDIQVLTPMNRGPLGTRSLNIELQKRLNNNPATLTRYGTTFALGDKVIQTVNNYDKEIFNGDIGRIELLDEKLGKIMISYAGNSVEYSLTDLDEVSLAYAITIHKSQGSEYPVVVIPLSTQHYPMLERNLLYTAMTRGKKLVIVIGEARALQLAIARVRSTQRLTNLQARLQGS